MTELEKNIITMINDNFTLSEIAYNLKLSLIQVHQKIGKLQSEGYYINPMFFDDGTIKYNLYIEQVKKHTTKLNLIDSSKFKALVISDLHVGNEYENLEYLDKAYDYARNHNINIILNCGDVIDGTFTRGNQTISDVDMQIQRVIDKYPYDKNILNIICFGNHDYSCVEDGRDIAKALYNKRHDLINGGYGLALINIEKDQFVMEHPLCSKKFKAIYNKFVLKGHHHRMMIKINHDNFFVNVPSLSDLCFGNQNNPGMIDMELSLDNGYIQNGYFKHLGVKNKVEILSEANLEFFLKHKFLDEKELILK